MAEGNDFLTGDDLEAILNVLDEDEAIEDDFITEVDNVQKQEIICNKCGKKYKTRGGFERHQASKHRGHVNSQARLDSSMLRELVNATIAKLTNNKAHSEILRKELSSYSFECPNDEHYKQLSDIFEGYMKNGSAEKFYSKYYSTVAINSVEFFRGLSRNAATLLAIKVADSLLAYKVKSTSQSTEVNSSTSLSDRDISCMQYLGGYVLHKLHSKHRLKTTSESQQAMAVLKAGKSSTDDNSQRLNSSMTWGGLWFITKPAQNIFSKTELFFRESTSHVGLNKVDFHGIVSKSISDSVVVSQYNRMVSEAELQPMDHVSKSVLYSIINLYVRVRSFSMAKDIIEHHKIIVKKAKAKSLRKEISRSCEEQSQTNERQD